MSMHALHRTIAAAIVLLAAAGCAGVDPAPRAEPTPRSELAPADPPPEPQPAAADGTRYACDNGLTIRARFTGDSVTLAGLPQGDEVLLRDAGGVTPEQTVWSNERMRAEFGLPPDSEGAALHLLQPESATVSCRRQ